MEEIRMKRGKFLAGILSLSMILSIVVPINAASSRVEELLANMTLRQKVTQMLMVDFRYWDTDLSDGEQTTGNEFTKMNSQVQKVVEDYDVKLQTLPTLQLQIKIIRFLYFLNCNRKLF